MARSNLIGQILRIAIEQTVLIPFELYLESRHHRLTLVSIIQNKFQGYFAAVHFFIAWLRFVSYLQQLVLKQDPFV